MCTTLRNIIKLRLSQLHITFKGLRMITPIWLIFICIDKCCVYEMIQAPVCTSNMHRNAKLKCA